MTGPIGYVRSLRILLKKSFLGDERNFLGPLMRFARGDVRDHIASHKNDHGPSYRRYRALQRQRRLKINFCEIFGVVRFSTFATLSARTGPPTMSAVRSLGGKRTWCGHPIPVAIDPKRASAHRGGPAPAIRRRAATSQLISVSPAGVPAGTSPRISTRPMSIRILRSSGLTGIISVRWLFMSCNVQRRRTASLSSKTG